MISSKMCPVPTGVGGLLLEEEAITPRETLKSQLAAAHRDKYFYFLRNALSSNTTKLELFGHYDNCYILKKKGTLVSLVTTSQL